MRGKNRTWLIPGISAVMLGLLCSGDTLAGFMATPLRADLDLAKMVVVGKIIDIVKDKEEYEGKMVWGRATVAVSEPLKGTTAKEITMLVVMHLDRENLGRSMQSPPHVYRKGDEGLWIIMADGRPLHGYGLLPKERLKDVKSALDDLDKRIWSEEVAGLKVWAAADMENPQDRPLRGTVMFAAKNVSTKPIYLPRSVYKDVVRAVAQDSSGKEFPLSGLGDQSTSERPLFSQDALQPGEIRYLHPYIEKCGFFGIPKEIPPGKYSIRITLANKVAQGSRGEKNPVVLWTGSVSAPAVTIEVPEETPSSQPASK